jgi:hypothetical protein
MIRVALLRPFRDEKRAAVAAAGHLGGTGAKTLAVTFFMIGWHR